MLFEMNRDWPKSACPSLNTESRGGAEVVFFQTTLITKRWNVVMGFLPDDAKNKLPTPGLILKLYCFLLLNLDNIKTTVNGPKQHKDKLTNDIAARNGFTLASSSTARNLGGFFNQHLSFNSKIKPISRNAFLHHCNIAKIRHTISQKHAEKPVYAFVTSRQDYCNSLLSSYTNKSLKCNETLWNPLVAWQLVSARR